VYEVRLEGRGQAILVCKLGAWTMFLCHFVFVFDRGCLRNCEHGQKGKVNQSYAPLH
jgi:hypothetical protein